MSDFSIEQLKEMKEQVKGIGKEFELKDKVTFFNKFFPTINDDDVKKFIVIMPESYKEKFKSANIKLTDWMVFSEYADDVFAYDNTAKPFDNLEFKREMEK
jgi:isopentenyldiphosphate isomerase